MDKQTTKPYPQTEAVRGMALWFSIVVRFGFQVKTAGSYISPNFLAIRACGNGK